MMLLSLLVPLLVITLLAVESVAHSSGDAENGVVPVLNDNEGSCAGKGGEEECEQVKNSLPDKKYTESDNQDSYPSVCAVMFAYENSPFLSLVLDSLYAQDYDKTLIDLNIFVLKGYYSVHVEQTVANWISTHNNGGYNSMSFETTFSLKDSLENMDCFQSGEKHVLLMDSRSHLTNSYTIKHLLQSKRSVLTPLLSRQNKYWSNFWDDASGFGSSSLTFRQLEESLKEEPQPPHPTFVPSDVGYVRSPRYLGIVERKQKGEFATPLAFGVIVFKSDVVPQLKAAVSKITPESSRNEWLFSLSLAWYLYEQRLSMFVTNVSPFGHLIDPSLFDPSKLHPEFYLVETNPFEWTALYLNEEYANFAQYGTRSNCTDVFLVPMFSPLFATHLIEECEAFGRWSGGDHKDERIQGGYEPVPTQDIHFKQIGFSPSWKYIIRTYLRPITSYYYTGYTLQGDQSLDFVVRYRPDKQDYLRPHHDASTVTLNVALNQGGVDYEGGGTRFVRQNCTLTNTKPGWGTLSPGRLTHLHEGLKTTKGTRYILVSFIDQ
eukprot:m.43925 g.43925  ORF g.43925 m.43925 type:complete len:547 (-) comp7137_c0_seq1:106-1746(-)